MHKLIIFLALTIGLAQAQNIPHISRAQFKVGNYWVWDIGNDQGLFSREKYTVVLVRGSRVTIEMSTAYEARDSFHLHHRFIVNLKDCKRAYPGPFSRKPFTIDLTRFENGMWGPTYKMHSRAFEEKFNCNAHHYENHSLYQTKFRHTANWEVFKQANLKDASDQLNGWYILSGKLAGVLAEKTFNEGSESEFLSELSEWSMD